METKDYRTTLEYINSVVPNGILLTISDVSKITGLARDTVIKHYGKDLQRVGTRQYINKTTLARLLAPAENAK